MLAVVTDIGKAHELRGRRLLERFAAHCRASFVATPPSDGAAVDGLAVRDGKVVAVLEAKVRGGYSLYDMRRMGATLLVTEEKLLEMCRLAKALAVPAVFVVEFSDGYRWFWRIADASGNRACRWEARRSVTRSDSVGGPDVERLNAFLPLDEGVCWYAPDEAAEAM